MTITLAFYKGRLSLNDHALPFDRAVCAWTGGDYSHVELIDLNDGAGWSSSYRDGGVRKKFIDWSSGRWDIYTLPGDPVAARDRIKKHLGEGYDVFGLFFFVIPLHLEARNEKFCSEIVSIGLDRPKPFKDSPVSLFKDLQATFGDQLQKQPAVTLGF